MNIYPANHILAGGANDDPSPMTLEEWTKNCLKYVNPSSTLGERLTNDPKNLAGQLGFYDAASVVTGTKITSSSANSCTVQVTQKGTQNTWADATEFKRSYIVDFNAGGLIIDVRETSNGPKAT